MAKRSSSENKSLREMAENLMQIPSPTSKDVNRVKTKLAGKNNMTRIPLNSEIVRVLKREERKKLLPILRRKATRTISGVTVVAVMTKPYPCPQLRPCSYCPGGPRIGVPQSYTGFEPAAMRGLQNKFDPYSQVRCRIAQLEAIGHTVDKIELIIMGGTFPASPHRYQTWFVHKCLDAITDEKSANLKMAKLNAETSKIRNVGITVETRPDWAKERHVDNMLQMGVTRVELGVQNPDDRIYDLVGRSHTVKDVIAATRILKDSGLKTTYHMMPGMPGSSRKKDLAAFSRIFNNSDFKPDMIKIYPCLVTEGTIIHDWYNHGQFIPITTEEAAELIAEIKKIIPPWIRVMRIQRDIPSPLIIAGVKKSNLRQIVHNELEQQGVRCRCIRCREIGHRETNGTRPKPEKIEIRTASYEASRGKELFISAEDPTNDILVGYLRLRIPSKQAHRPEVKTEACSMVRELHVCGPLVPVGKHLTKAWQHKGYGALLLAEAERISKEEHNLRKIFVISALGTKQYYRRFGYEARGVYMSKDMEN